jgi:hypothetical protein
MKDHKQPSKSPFTDLMSGRVSKIGKVEKAVKNARYNFLDEMNHASWYCIQITCHQKQFN